MTEEIRNKFVPQVRTVPTVNQVERNPYYRRQKLRKILDKRNVKLEAWGPFGQGNRKLLTDPVLGKIAQEHEKISGRLFFAFFYRAVLSL